MSALIPVGLWIPTTPTGMPLFSAQSRQSLKPCFSIACTPLYMANFEIDNFLTLFVHHGVSSVFGTKAWGVTTSIPEESDWVTVLKIIYNREKVLLLPFVIIRFAQKGKIYCGDNFWNLQKSISCKKYSTWKQYIPRSCPVDKWLGNPLLWMGVFTKCRYFKCTSFSRTSSLHLRQWPNNSSSVSSNTMYLGDEHIFS